MRKALLTYLLLVVSLLAFVDSDLDGVEDALDKCPGTPFSDLVDLDGCSVESLVPAHHFDIIVGVSYSGADFNTLSRSDTFATSFQADYYYKHIALTLSSSYYTVKDKNSFEENGFYDTFLAASYRFDVFSNVSLYFGGGVLLPTYDTPLRNNKSDYQLSCNATYGLRSFNIFAGYAYTFVNDEAVTLSDATQSYTLAYQNTNAAHAGIGYYFHSSLYGSVSYSVSQSIYSDVSDIQSVSLYLYYTIDTHWFMTASYARGLSQSATDNYAALRLGYYY